MEMENIWTNIAAVVAAVVAIAMVSLISVHASADPAFVVNTVEMERVLLDQRARLSSRQAGD
jgi:hypothetical protein